MGNLDATDTVERVNGIIQLINSLDRETRDLNFDGVSDLEARKALHSLNALLGAAYGLSQHMKCRYYKTVVRPKAQQEPVESASVINIETEQIATAQKSTGEDDQAVHEYQPAVEGEGSSVIVPHIVPEVHTSTCVENIVVHSGSVVSELGSTAAQSVKELSPAPSSIADERTIARPRPTQKQSTSRGPPPELDLTEEIDRLLQADVLAKGIDSDEERENIEKRREGKTASDIQNINTSSGKNVTDEKTPTTYRVSAGTNAQPSSNSDVVVLSSDTHDDSDSDVAVGEKLKNLSKRGPKTRSQRRINPYSDEEESGSSSSNAPKTPGKRRNKRLLFSDDEDDGESDDDSAAELSSDASEKLSSDEETNKILRAKVGSESDSDSDTEKRKGPRRSKRLAGASNNESSPRNKEKAGEKKKMKRSSTKDSGSTSDLSSNSESSSPSSGDNGDAARDRQIQKRKQKRRVIIDTDDELNGSEAEEENDKEPEPQKKKRKTGHLSATTKGAEREERERIKRLQERDAAFNGIVFGETSETEVNGAAAATIVKVVLDADSTSPHPIPVEIPKQLVKILKPHQISGIKFLYELTVEDLKRLYNHGGGGILAHCMGLGKTIQSIAFLYTLLSHPKIGKVIKRALCVAPKNVVVNWEYEFQKWLNDLGLHGLDVTILDATDMNDRLTLLKEWHTSTRPSVMIISYEMYRILVTDPLEPNKKGVAPKATAPRKRLQKMIPQFRSYLQNPGPDIVICDEGHKLKNVDSKLSQAMSGIATSRRICLTDHTMINFVKPGLLGSQDEFRERFVKPIIAGQAKDADSLDVAMMRRRSFVLFKKLNKVVDRKDYTYLTKVIPEKHEYVIHIRLTKDQIKLYTTFLDIALNSEGDLNTRMLADYYIFSRIWTFPYMLVNNAYAKSEEAEDDIDNFIDDSECPSTSKKTAKKKAPRPTSEDEDDDAEVREPSESNSDLFWYRKVNVLDEQKDKHNYSVSQKLMVLVDIIKQAESIGDKLLVFSQSRESLDIIEGMLRHMRKGWFADHEVLKRSNDTWSWEFNKDYFVITGDVGTGDREKIQRSFNDPMNPRGRLCLISTRAGSLGTNMVAANRVVIFDACWNPSHDTQALFRAYRYGQTKPVFVYRLIADGTMEDYIYKKQINKESTAMRVVDEKQIKRNFTRSEVTACYTLDTHPYNPDIPSNLNPPKDRILRTILVNRPEAIYKYEERDSLLEHIVEETLTPEERKNAWLEYENENHAKSVNSIWNVAMTPVEALFITHILDFVRDKHREGKIHEQADPNKTHIGDILLNMGCDYERATCINVMHLGLNEIYSKGTQQVKAENPDLEDCEKFILERYSAHPFDKAFQYTLLDCRNRIKDLHRRFSHIAELQETFNFLNQLKYLLTDEIPNQFQYYMPGPQQGMGLPPVFNGMHFFSGVQPPF